jgi:hypothetical protein
MNWLERARREIPENAIRPTAITAERTLTAVLAVPHPSSEASNGSIGSTPPGDFQKITPLQLEEFEERAAIMEFDGCLSRSVAERAAWALVSNGNAYPQGKDH